MDPVVSAAAFSSCLLRAWAGLSFSPLDLGFYFGFLVELNFPPMPEICSVVDCQLSPYWPCLIPHKISRLSWGLGGAPCVFVLSLHSCLRESTLLCFCLHLYSLQIMLRFFSFKKKKVKFLSPCSRRGLRKKIPQEPCNNMPWHYVA